MSKRMFNGWNICLSGLLLLAAKADSFGWDWRNANDRHEKPVVTAKDGTTVSVEVIVTECRAGVLTESRGVELQLGIKSEKDNLIIDDTAARTFSFVVKTKDGKAVPKTAFGQIVDRDATSSFFHNAHVIVVPGRPARVTINIGSLYDLSAGGEYTIVLTCRFHKFGPVPNHWLDDTITVADVPISLDRQGLPPIRVDEK